MKTASPSQEHNGGDVKGTLIEGKMFERRCPATPLNDM